jgi:hypothetical protein
LQTYKCKICGHKFQNKRRKQKSNIKFLNQYVWKRQTYFDLAEKYNKSEKWAQRKLDEIEVKSIVKLNSQPLVVVADTTFFSRMSGLTVFREPNFKKNIWWKFVDYERVRIYEMGRKHLERNGFTVQAVVLDGRRGVREVFSDIPVQMCHFHQKQIVRKYLTLNPKLEAGKELKTVISNISCTDEQTFTEELNTWHDKWEDFLKERTTDLETGKWFYTHKKLRSAYRSLKTNLPYLFTYQKYPKLNIPNTTNSLDGFFNRLKSLLNVHRGLNPKRREKIVVEILKGKSSK